MNIETIIFYGFATLVAVSALLILISKNVLYSAFALLLTFLGVAAIYIFAGADFIAVTQVIVYAGGILVLLIFGVMFTKKSRESGALTGNRKVFQGITLASLIFMLLVAVISDQGFLQTVMARNFTNPGPEGTTGLIGVNLMTDFVLALEVAAILLLVALIGSAYIAGKELKK